MHCQNWHIEHYHHSGVKHDTMSDEMYILLTFLQFLEVVIDLLLVIQAVEKNVQILDQLLFASLVVVQAKEHY